MFAYEGNDRIYFGCAAHIVQEAEELAWAEQYVTKNSNYKWILGKYAEAENANRNRQFMTETNLKHAQDYLDHAPLNINHTPKIVGAFAASQMIFPTPEQAAEGIHPYLEALSAMWKARFPEEFEDVEKAHRSNSLFYSMEARPERIHCGGEHGCDQEFAYIARTDPSYCTHLNNFTPGILRDMLNPRFMGGALIIPPVRPGWGEATIEEISSFVKDRDDELHKLETEIALEAPEASPQTWETLAIHVAAIAECDDTAEFAKKWKAFMVRAKKRGAKVPAGY